MKARLFELICACAFAFAQPLFDLMGRNPEFLVAHRLYGMGLLAFVLGLVAVPPLLLWAVELGAHRLRPSFVPKLHYGLLTLLFTATALAPLQRTVSLNPAVLIVTAFAVGALAIWLVSRYRRVRSVLRLGAVSAVFFVGLFLARPDVWTLLTAAPASGAITERDAGSKGSVLVVVVDALPLASILDAEGRIDSQRFPNLAALAADGVWFKNASTSADFTARAVPAIVSGQFPEASPSAHWSSYPDNLFTLLAPTHETIASEWVTSLCPPQLDRTASGSGNRATLIDDVWLVYLHALLPEPIVRGLPSVSEGWRAFGHSREGVLGEGTLGQRVGHIDAFIDRIAPGDEPVFSFLHTVLPHRPYGLYRSGHYYSSTGSELGGRTEDGRRVADEQVANHAWQRHLLQAAYVDERLGDIIRRWREAGRYDDSMIVVVADHGVSFEPRQPARHLGNANDADVLPVPLVIKLPGGKRGGEVSLRNVETIDILPTIADILEIPLAFEVDGQSALDESLEARVVKRAIVSANGNVREFEPNLISGAQTTADRRIDLFGDSGFPAHDLLGHGLDEFTLSPGEPIGFVANSAVQVSVADEDLLLPGEAFGFLRVPRHGYQQMRIVISVDGIIRAVTRPYRPWSGRDLAVWYALLPEETLPSGAHRIEPFLVQEGPDGISLRPVDGTELAPSYFGLQLGTTAYLGVETEGILESKKRAEDYVRVEIPMRADERPRSLRVMIETLDPEGTDITIDVNGSRVLEQRLEHGEFREALKLEGLEPGEAVRIELRGAPLSLDPESDWTFGTVEMQLGR